MREHICIITQNRGYVQRKLLLHCGTMVCVLEGREPLLNAARLQHVLGEEFLCDRMFKWTFTAHKRSTWQVSHSPEQDAALAHRAVPSYL